MNLPSNRFLGSITILVIWVVTLLFPVILMNNVDGVCMTEIEHHEQESENEELSIELDETTFDRFLHSCKRSNSWNTAHHINMRLHERLDTSRLLDPPDKTS